MQRFAWSAQEIGYSLGFIGLLMALVQGLLIKKVIPRIGLRGAGILGMSCTTVAFLGYAGASESWIMYLAMIPGALGALAGPALMAWHRPKWMTIVRESFRVALPA